MSLVAKAPAADGRGFALPHISSARFVPVALVAITVFAVFYQQRWGTITDTSWLITVCERVLPGDRLYIDIVETNPPFSVWLYMPPVALAKALGIAPEILVHAWTYSAAFVGLGFAGIVVRRAGFPEAPTLFWLAPAFYALLVIMPGNAFSQRDHIGMALFLPLLALTAWRAREEAPPPSAGIAVFAGLCGSVLVLVKPYYALMVLAPALFVVVRRRSLRPLFAPEYWTIGVACIAYLSLILVFHRAFIEDIYPMVAETYVQVRFLPTLLERYTLPYAAVMVLVWFLSRRRGDTSLATVAILASAAGIVCLVYQGKGFPYHAYPAFLLALVALLCLLALPRADGRAGWMSLRAVLVPLVTVVVILYAFTPFRAGSRPDAALVEAVRAVAERPTVAQIGTDLSIGHPFSREIGGRWVSAYSSDWLGSSALMLSEAGGPDAGQHLATARDYTARKRAELERTRPDIIVTQNNDILWQKIMAEEDGLAPFLQSYRLLAEGRRMRVLIRNDYNAAKSDPLTPE
jgi:hypothetical protein